MDQHGMQKSFLMDRLGQKARENIFMGRVCSMEIYLNGSKVYSGFGFVNEFEGGFPSFKMKSLDKLAEALKAGSLTFDDFTNWGDIDIQRHVDIEISVIDKVTILRSPLSPEQMRTLAILLSYSKGKTIMRDK